MGEEEARWVEEVVMGPSGTGNAVSELAACLVVVAIVVGSGSSSIGMFRYVNRPSSISVGSRLLCASAIASTSRVGSIAVTLSVVGSRAADSANIPPPQPTSRYRTVRFEGPAVGSTEGCGCAPDMRHERMNVWRSGFMRWRRRDGPCGSHHEEARAPKWDTSEGSTVDCEERWEVLVVRRRAWCRGRRRWSTERAVRVGRVFMMTFPLWEVSLGTRWSS